MRFITELAIYMVALGGVSFLLAAGLAYALGRSWLRVLALLVMGGLAVATVTLLVEVLPGSDCYECVDVQGVRVSPVLLYVLLPAQVIGWVAGTALGSTLRLVAAGRRS